jgi:hypothetical protein
MAKQQKIHAHRILKSEQEMTLKDRLHNNETGIHLCTADKLALFKKHTFTLTAQSKRNSR